MNHPIIQKLIAAKHSLNMLLEQAAVLGIDIDVLVGLSPPHRSATGYYTAKEVHISVNADNLQQ